jgi:probable rRNA maturation factor
MRIDVFGTTDRRLIADVRRMTVLPVLRRLGAGTVNVAFVTDRFIHLLNRRFLGRNRPTDVLAFPRSRPPVPARNSESLAGEVYVSRDRARIQARTYRQRYGEELRRLVLHGLLHLAGLTHRQMARQEGTPQPATRVSGQHRRGRSRR